MMIKADLGLDPWDVLHQGLTRYLPVSFGTVTIIVGAIVLLLWIPLRQWPGLGTVSNVFVIGLAADFGLGLLPSRTRCAVRIAACWSRSCSNGLAGAVYIGSHFGPGPRDGLMTGLVARTGGSCAADPDRNRAHRARDRLPARRDGRRRHGAVRDRIGPAGAVLPAAGCGAASGRCPVGRRAGLTERRVRMTGWTLPMCGEVGAITSLVGAGLVSYGLIHLVLAWIAIKVAAGRKGDASQTGALTELAKQPLGAVLLWVMAIGLFTLTIWQVLEATIGREQSGRDGRLRRRLASAGRAIVYVAFGILAVGVAMGSGSHSGQGEQTISAKLMAVPFGQVLVVAIGVAVIGVGVSQVVKGVKQNFTEDLDSGVTRGRSPARRHRLLRQGRRAGDHRRAVRLGGDHLRPEEGRRHGCRTVHDPRPAVRQRAAGDHGARHRLLRCLLLRLGSQSPLLIKEFQRRKPCADRAGALSRQDSVINSRSSSRSTAGRFTRTTG